MGKDRSFLSAFIKASLFLFIPAILTAPLHPRVSLHVQTLLGVQLLLN